MRPRPGLLVAIEKSPLSGPSYASGRGIATRAVLLFFLEKRGKFPRNCGENGNQTPGGAKSTAAAPVSRISSAGTIRNCVTGATTHWAMRMPRFTVKASAAEIDEDHLHLAAIIAVDGARAVEHGDSGRKREARTRPHLRFRAGGQFENDPVGMRARPSGGSVTGSFSAMAAARSKPAASALW